MLQKLQTPTAGTIIGALLLIFGGIVVVAGGGFLGTLVACGGFGLILKYRVLPAARRNRKK